MVGKMSGRDVPACGFSIGFERIIGVLSDKGFVPPSLSQRLALIFDPGRDRVTDVAKAAADLRGRGFAVNTQPRKKDMTKQIEQLSGHGFSKFCSFKGDLENLEIKDVQTT
jgi:histidyl-tRNA synthetase